MSPVDDGYFHETIRLFIKMWDFGKIVSACFAAPHTLGAMMMMKVCGYAQSRSGLLGIVLRMPSGDHFHAWYHKHHQASNAEAKPQKKPKVKDSYQFQFKPCDPNFLGFEFRLHFKNPNLMGKRVENSYKWYLFWPFWRRF